MSWLRKIENLKPGDACEFRWPARSIWRKGEVVLNGGAGYWVVKLTESYIDEEHGGMHDAGAEAHGIYIEHVRLPGQTEAWN
jgi:hypothetical protein